MNMFISVACVIGPSVNTYFIFHILGIEFFLFGNVNTLKARLIFPSKPKIWNLFEFLEIYPLKNQYLPHF
jgi:hypothetical protein